MKRLTLLALVLSLYVTCLVLGQRHLNKGPTQLLMAAEDPNDPNEVTDPNDPNEPPFDPGE